MQERLDHEAAREEVQRLRKQVGDRHGPMSQSSLHFNHTGLCLNHLYTQFKDSERASLTSVCGCASARWRA
jgi:hypothetical protein